ncbi:MAG: hypothetical protein ACU84J_08480 [Gammaproteobacteria bacterium]
MKILLPIVIVGLIVQYFMDSAFDIHNMNLEMSIHNTVRFVAGFVFLGIWVWYGHRMKLKVALYFVLALLISDDIMDYLRNINSLKLEIVLHDSYIVLWGAITGYFFMRSLKHKTFR